MKKIAANDEKGKVRAFDRLARLHAYLDAVAVLVTGDLRWEQAAARSDLSEEQRNALRVMLHAATAAVDPSLAATKRLRTLAAAIGTYAEHGDKDLAYWRAAMAVEAAVEALKNLPAGVKGTGVATWLVGELGEIDAALLAWRDQRDEVLRLLRSHAAKRTKGKRTTSAIVAVLVREVGALGHRADAKGSTGAHTTQAVAKAMKRFTRR